MLSKIFTSTLIALDARLVYFLSLPVQWVQQCDYTGDLVDTEGGVCPEGISVEAVEHSAVSANIVVNGPNLKHQAADRRVLGTRMLVIHN